MTAHYPDRWAVRPNPCAWEPGAASGWRPMLDLIEYEIGWELPAGVDREALEEVVCDCLSIVSDLFGYRHGQGANAVACSMREFGEAFKWAGHVHSGTGRGATVQPAVTPAWSDPF